MNAIGLIQRNKILSALLAIAVVLTGSGITSTFSSAAQIDENRWTEPINLSQSGSTTDPKLIVDANGVVHAIWLDLNAGFIYSRLGDDGWSAPAFVDFPFNPANVEVMVAAGAFDIQPPLLITDSSGFIHAFWQGALNALLYSRVVAPAIADPSAWLRPRTIAESAADIDIEIDEGGRFHMVYARTIGVFGLPAGIYYRYSNDNGLNWTQGVPLYVSRYLQGLEFGDVNVNIGSLSNEEENQLFVTWDNPRLRRVYLLRSIDRGGNWGEVTEVAGPKSASIETPYNIDVFARDNRVLLTWHSDLGGRTSCTHYYQTSVDGGNTWNEPMKMLERNLSCPSGLQYLGDVGRRNIFWTELEGQVYLLAWDGEMWSEPQRQSNINQFTNPVTLQRILFGCEQGLLLPANQLLVIGCEEENNGDIWVTSRIIDSVEGWYSLEDNRKPPVVAVADGLEIHAPAVATGENGMVHMIWPQVVPAEGLEPEEREAFFYAEQDGEAWVLSGEVVASPKGKVSQPSLALDVNGKLYLVWSEGRVGDLYFSWASASKAAARAEWIEPKLLPSLRSVNSAPEITVNDFGVIFVVYAIPLNEDRGIYLTRSMDFGENWTEPVRLFDAMALGWDMVDYPHLAIAQNGELHVIWTRYPLLGASGSSGLYYSRSVDDGETWIEPQPVTDHNVQWSQLIVSGRSLHRLWLESLKDASVLWHEVSRDNGVTWNRFTVLSGFGEQEDEFSLVSDGFGGLHLIQVAESGVENWVLRYFSWDGERWSIQNETDLSIPLNSEIVSSRAALLPDNRVGIFYAVNRPDVVEGKNVLNFIDLELAIPESLTITAAVETPPAGTPASGQNSTSTSTPTPEPASSAGEPAGTQSALTTLAQLPAEIAQTATAQASIASNSQSRGNFIQVIILLGISGILLLGLVFFIITIRRRRAERG